MALSKNFFYLPAFDAFAVVAAGESADPLAVDAVEVVGSFQIQVASVYDTDSAHILHILAVVVALLVAAAVVVAAHRADSECPFLSHSDCFVCSSDRHLFQKYRSSM